jgi:hypothetical protein
MWSWLRSLDWSIALPTIIGAAAAIAGGFVGGLVPAKRAEKQEAHRTERRIRGAARLIAEELNQYQRALLAEAKARYRPGMNTIYPPAGDSDAWRENRNAFAEHMEDGISFGYIQIAYTTLHRLSEANRSNTLIDWAGVANALVDLDVGIRMAEAAAGIMGVAAHGGHASTGERWHHAGLPTSPDIEKALTREF